MDCYSIKAIVMIKIMIMLLSVYLGKHLNVDSCYEYVSRKGKESKVSKFPKVSNMESALRILA